jgi:hypothetical protein
MRHTVYILYVLRRQWFVSLRGNLYLLDSFDGYFAYPYGVWRSPHRRRLQQLSPPCFGEIPDPLVC